uniref:hypothetical protein n=1 Tax=Shewanella sp. TaxID=50422 RepID=UPI00404745F6
MAFRKTYVKKRKPYTKKKTYAKKAQIVNKPMVSLGLGFPKKLMATLKYREYVYLTSTSGVLQNYHFAANGMYDPNLTGTGHQPMYFDQYMALYNHYHVIGSKIKVSFIHSTSSTLPIATGIFLNDDTSAPSTTYTGFSEQTQSKMKILGPSQSDDREVLSYKFSAKKIFGNNVIANNALRGNSGANPSEVSTYNIFFQALDESSTVGAYCWVELEYIAIFTELKDFAQS